MQPIAIFTQQDEVQHRLEMLREEGISQKIFSDCLDEDGFQYVDLVQEGGGVLGVSLVGYTWLLEQMGLRFASMAGTSAGAINTMLLLAAKNQDLGSEWVLQAVANTSFVDFMDGPRPARKLVDNYLKGKGMLSSAIPLLRLRKYLSRNLGLHPGNAFEAWMQKLLQQAGINHSRDVETYLASLKERLLHRHSARPIHPPQLALVAAELSTRSKLRFPEMAELIWREEASVHPAKWVRASMSIPGFFHPLKQKIPHFASKRAEWSEWTGYRGEALQEATLVDGGLISNFPIHVFHRDEVPERPTFGIRLNNDRAVAQSIDSISALAGSSLSTARQFFDYDFLHKNPDYTQLIGYIHTGAYDWLDFNLSLEAKKDLFLRGVRAADAFLRRFDWARYKKLRARLLEQ